LTPELTKEKRDVAQAGALLGNDVGVDMGRGDSRRTNERELVRHVVLHFWSGEMEKKGHAIAILFKLFARLWAMI